MSVKPFFLLTLVAAFVVLVQMLLQQKRSTDIFLSEISSPYKTQTRFTTSAGNDTGTTNSSRTATVPEALQPSDFRGCCTQLTDNPKAQSDEFRATCRTPIACSNNTLYPFQSLEEKKFMEPYSISMEEEKELIKHCQEAADRLYLEPTWCIDPAKRNDYATKEMRIPDSVYPTGCSRYSMGACSGPFDRLLIFASAKLAFCGVPKAGITRWLHFLRFTFGAKDYQDLPYNKLDVGMFYFDKLHPKSQHAIWNDLSWTRAVLIREPTERLLSAYLNKIQSRKDLNITFSEFVAHLELPATNSSNSNFPPGLSWYTDPHWRPQAFSCGLAQLLPHFDYVGGLDHAAKHARGILDRVGLWESHGQHYRTTKLSNGAKLDYIGNGPPPLDGPPEGFQQEQGSSDHHSREAQSKINKYYTPELLERVQKLYWMDYALWDAVQEAGNRNQHHGKDVALILNQKKCGGS